MNQRQRIVLIVAAAALAVTIDRAVMASAVGGGWFGYAPNTDVVFTPGLDWTRQLLVRLALLGGWTLLSLRLLRNHGQE